MVEIHPDFGELSWMCWKPSALMVLTSNAASPNMNS